MQIYRFNELLEELITGLPVTMVVNRLELALVYVVKSTGEAGEKALEEFCEEHDLDSDKAEEGD
jgi:hypothetical protein